MNRLFLLCLSLACVLSAKPLRITVDGRPNAGIAVSGGGKDAPGVKLAADELRLWVQKISGAELPLAEASQEGAVQIRLICGGDAAFAAEAAKIGETDGYAVRVRDNVLSLYANRPRGVLNAVHRLLFRNTDIIWARPNVEFGTVYSQNPTIEIASEDYVDVPVFVQRGWQMEINNRKTNRNDYLSSELWQLRNGSNWSTANESEKVQFDYILEYGGGHNLIGLYIQPKKYWQTHPEYYSQIGGKLTDPLKYSERTQLCFTNPELLEVFKKELDERIQASPQYTVYRVMIEDNFNMCECPNCLKDITLPDGRVLKGDAKPRSPEWLQHRNTQFFTWYNELAKFMKAKYPGKRLLSFAYFFTEPAPLIPLEDNIDISFCPIFKDSRGSIHDPRNNNVLERINRWLKVTKNVTWREYYGLNVEFPRPIDAVAFADYAYVASQGMRKTYSEMVCDGPFNSRWRGDVVWDLSAPYLWNLTNAVWNPNQDCRELRRVFFLRCFGKAAMATEAAYAGIEEAWSQNKIKSMWNDRPKGLWALLKRNRERVEAIRASLQKAIDTCDKPNGRIMLERLKAAYDAGTYFSDVRLKAAKVTAAPPEDPTLTEGPWATAPTYTEFDGCPYPTTVKLLHDGTHLYAAMRAERPGVKALLKPEHKYTQLEGFNFFFEILDPNTNEPNGYHFLDDPLGRAYDSLTGNKHLKMPWKHKEYLSEDGWTIFYTLPLEPMTKPLKAAFFRRHTRGNDIWPNFGYGLKGTEMHSYYSFVPLDLEE